MFSEDIERDRDINELRPCYGSFHDRVFYENNWRLLTVTKFLRNKMLSSYSVTGPRHRQSFCLNSLRDQY